MATPQDDPAFVEFEANFEARLKKDHPRLKFDRARLYELFHSWFDIITYSHISIMPNDGELLAVVSWADPEEEYLFDANKQERRELAEAIGEVFIATLEPFRFSDYAEKKRAESQQKSRTEPDVPKRSKQATTEETEELLASAPTLSQKDTARIFGVSTKSIRNYFSQRLLVKVQNGRATTDSIKSLLKKKP